MADGSITFSTELDNKELEKQLSRLNADVKKKTEKLTQMKGERLPLEEQSAQVAANLDRAKELLAHMNSGDEFFPKESIKEQAQSVAQLQKEWDAIQAKVESYDTKIRNGETDLARTKEQAGAVEKQLSAAASGGSAMGDAINKAQAYMDKFATRVKKLAKRVFVFTVITGALRSVKNWMWQVIQTSDEAKSAMGQLKGALLTMAERWAELVLPLFVAFLRVLMGFIAALG